MTTRYALGPAPVPTWALLLLATAAALVLRVWGGYPHAPSDEHNWSDIALAVLRGADWPISGPLHFEVTQALARVLTLSPASALAVLGVMSVPAVLGMYVVAYRWLGFDQVGWLLLASSLSTYFWAPLLESRPQQWGQALTLLCMAGNFRLLGATATTTRRHYFRAWVSSCMLFLLLACTHILSTAITFGLCLTLAVTMMGTHQTTWPKVTLLLAATVPGLLLLFWPTGPYKSMWLDIRQNHLQIDLSTLGIAATAALALAICWTVWARSHGAALLRATLAYYDSHPRLCTTFLLVLTVCMLGLQAQLLPAQAWHLYQGSAVLFVLLQLGNLAFLGLVFLGLHFAREAHLTDPNAPWRHMADLLSSAGLVALGLLLASFYLLDTNWLLRFINYALLLASPFAALAAMRLVSSKGARWIWWTLVSLSLSVTARPSELLG